jgi:hypothetical protein
VYVQSNIRVESDTVVRLKAQAKKLGHSYSGLCSKILNDALICIEAGSYSLVSSDALKISQDIENSRF